MQKIMNFIKDEDGLELTEYAVIGAIIVVTVSVAVVALREEILTAFEGMTDAMNQ